jgi:hypothetical protein
MSVWKPLLNHKELTEDHKAKLKKILEQRRKELEKALDEVGKGLKMLDKNKPKR